MLDAIAQVPRDRFVPADLRPEAWENIPLPIGAGQTISQPLVVARMCELLELTGDETVLDVGTGSGYHAAVLARLVRAVCSIELHASLSRRPRENLPPPASRTWSWSSATARAGSPGAAPYDAINVAAAAGGADPAALASSSPPAAGSSRRWRPAPAARGARRTPGAVSCCPSTRSRPVRAARQRSGA